MLRVMQRVGHVGCVGYGLGLMSIGVIIGKKAYILPMCRIGLGLMSIGVIIGKKTYILTIPFTPCCGDGWLDSSCE